MKKSTLIILVIAVCAMGACYSQKDRLIHAIRVMHGMH